MSCSGGSASPIGFPFCTVADWINTVNMEGHRVHSIVQGVETDADGMVIAYWICNQHPLSSLVEIVHTVCVAYRRICP